MAHAETSIYVITMYCFCQHTNIHLTCVRFTWRFIILHFTSVFQPLKCLIQVISSANAAIWLTTIRPGFPLELIVLSVVLHVGNVSVELSCLSSPHIDPFKKSLYCIGHQSYTSGVCVVYNGTHWLLPRYRVKGHTL